MTERGSSRFAWPVRRRTPADLPGPDGTAEDIAAQDIAEREAADRRLPPPPPEPIVEAPPRFNVAVFRLGGLGLALVLALVVALIRVIGTGPPSIAQLRAEAGVDGWPFLTVGVKGDQPGIGYYDPKQHSWSGFDVDIAYMIAEDLGFRRQEVKFYAIESEDRARMQATDPASDPPNKRVPVNMVIASYSITAERIANGVHFSVPYLYTEQSVVTLKDHSPVNTLNDLAHKKVCSLSASTSSSALTQAKADVVTRNQVSECFGLLYDHGVEAISTDAAILGGYKAGPDGAKIRHWDIGLDRSEKWGINVGENKALETLVNITLYKSWKDPHDDRWELAYRNNIQPEIDENLPTPLAVAEQPPVVPRPDVRQLPWETDLP
ncbi:transporter substrate-binding domain-containing protein [Actinoplanes sp. KI2]|uniref:transporter substrate-binding domain-containing protein n=1 Tax=Actinoplanes sp. KI2 TaxID=2983315 RepID=UPI0021D592EC|nr:transporter substrate-binding domain-containing protein [Actinoplanes sp. KI2]MCU7724708.1 transporter substrate-binding domain-containing protein [Actinoplanes sp. KI2]